MSPDLSLRELRYFVTVYQERSFSAAARTLFMTQPPLSQAIASLERSLGVTLFERSTRALTPTPAADALWPEAVDLLRRAAEAPARLHSARATDSGRPTVRIGAISSTFTTFLAHFLPALDAVHPSVTDMASSDAMAALAAGRLDLALTRESAGHGPEELRVVDERFFVAVPHGHRLAGRAGCTAGELRDEPVIAFDRSMAPLAFDAIAACFRLADVPLRPAAHIRSEQAAIGLVRAGLGISVVPEMLTRSTWDGIDFLELRDSPVTAPLWASVAPGDPYGLLPMVRRASATTLTALGIPAPDAVEPPAPRE